MSEWQMLLQDVGLIAALILGGLWLGFAFERWMHRRAARSKDEEVPF